VKAVYDHIITNTVYDIERSYDQTIYSVMVLGEGVCTGYAKATQYLLGKLGILCTYVTGDIPGRESHAWNLVMIDGEYYHLDTTWGDPLFSGGEQPDDFISYDYFCITTKDILKTHRIDTDWPLPECTAAESNYYVKNRLYFDGYSYEAILQVARDAMEEGGKAFSFRFSDEDAYRQAVSQLFENNDIFRMFRDVNRPVNAISYVLNDDLFIIKILL
jgi:hypothetical protein